MPVVDATLLIAEPVIEEEPGVALIPVYNLSNHPIEQIASCQFFGGEIYLGEDLTDIVLGPRQWKILTFYHQWTNQPVTAECHVDRL